MSSSSKLVRYVTYPLWLFKHGEFDLLRYIKEFDRLQYLSREQLESLKWKKIKDIIRHAYQNVPFYNKLFRENGISIEEIKDLNDFEKIPVISKQDIRENISSISAKNFSAKQLLKSNTGCSTGIPLAFYRDKRCLLYRRAIDFVFNRWLGVEIGDWVGWAWGASQDIVESKNLKAKLANRLIYRSFFLSFEYITPKNIQVFIDQIKAKKPKLL